MKIQSGIEEMMDQLNAHPATVLSADDIAFFRAEEAAAEKRGEWSDKAWERMFQRNWLAIFIPREYAGLGYDLPQAVKLEEALAYCSGSLGWTVTLCSGANWFIGFMHPEQRRQLFGNGSACLAGSGKMSGTAALQEDGSYIVNGSWAYATGARHATALTANCIILTDGKPVLDAKGQPLTKAFWFLPSELSLKDDWEVIGLNATGSIRFEVDQLRVPAERSFIILPGNATLSEPIYHFPFLEFARVTILANLMGMAVRFYELAGKAISQANESLLILETRIFEQHRKQYYELLAETWKIFTGEMEGATDWQTLSRQHFTMIRSIRDSLARLVPLCGIEIISSHSGIGQVWRNMLAACQHPMLREEIGS